MRTSAPQIEHRNRRFTFRKVPDPGSGGTCDSPRNTITPNRSITKAATTATTSFRIGLAQALDDGGVGHTATLAHRLQPPTAATALKFRQQRGHEAGARRAERMTQGDGATVHVDLGHVGVVLLLPRQDD